MRSSTLGRRLATFTFTALVGLSVGCGDDFQDPVPDPDPDTPQDTPDDTPEVTGFDDPAIQDVLDLPATALSYQPANLPDHFETAAVEGMINTPADNPITDAGATLGRVLFYDTALSANRTVACASCHQSGAGFSDPDALSEGFDGGLTGRNSMSMVNLRYYANGAMFWDERAATLEEQVLMPIQDETEMGMTLDEVVERLEATDHYPVLFELAFGDPAITSERMSLALAQFARAAVSATSRYDEGLAAVDGDPLADFPAFTDAENRGKRLFFAPPNQGGAACAGCHVANDGPGGGQRNAAVFFMDRARNNGLTADNDADPGLGGHTGLDDDMGLFKSPSLRNVAVTGPYMHDGSLETLRDVVEHYNDGVQANPNLDPALRAGGGQPRRLGLDDGDIDDLVAFMQALTDDAFMADERFHDPFRR